MSAEEQTQPDMEKPSWYMTFSKILFFVLAFLAVIFTVLANISGNSDTFKQAIEDYVAGATGYHAHVGKLNHAALFPNITFDFEDLELRAKENDPTPAASIEEIQFKVGFFDVVSGNGKFKDINIEGINALPGVILPKAVTQGALIIEDKDDGGAILKAQATIGADIFSATSDVDVFGEGKKTSYSFGGPRHIEIKLGDLKANTDIDNGVVENLEISLQEQDVITGNLKISEKRKGIKVRGALTFTEHGTVLNPNLLISHAALKGILASPKFHIEDIGAISLWQKTLDEVERVLVGPENKKENKDFKFPFEKIDLVLETEEFHMGKGNLGPLSVPIKMRDGLLDIVLGGKFAGSDLSGHISLNAQALPASLDVDVALHRLDYGAMQQSINESAEVTGTGDFVLKMKSEGRSSKALAEGLNGQAIFIGGKGEFKSGAVNIWGGGLVNAILPDANPEDALGVNCAIMDFKIKDGIANAETLFLDGTHVTLAGEGTYNIAEDDLDISIKPKPKEFALGNIGAAIKISGPLGNPSIGPSLFDFGLGIGKLLLGTINPAFMALSLADIGVNEEHPCHEFIGVTPE